MSAITTSTLQFQYLTLRNISCPDDKTAKREVYFGQAPGESFLKLPNNENVRKYLTDAEGKQRKASTQVNRAIASTLNNIPGDFSFLNTGITIVAKSVTVNSKTQEITLVEPSIINGAQTQGELRKYYQAVQNDKQNNGRFPDEVPDEVSDEVSDEVKVTFELIVTSDSELIDEISIARNFQNDVMAISIAGKRGQFQKLNEEFRKRHDRPLRMSETDRGEKFVETERLLQVITALIPTELWPNQKEKENPNKVFAYSQKSKCLKMFTDMVSGSETSEKSKKLYDFYLDIAGEAWTLYDKWKTHQGFRGTKLKCIKRNKDYSIKEVPDGVVFPIIVALSVFIKKTKKGWKLAIPKELDDQQIILSAKTALMEIASSNPNFMGKSKPCYSQVKQITSLYAQILGN